MYIPPAFREEDLGVLHGLMRQYSFATLVTPDLCASHLPLLLDAERGRYGTLRGHMARANPQWEAFGAGDVLAIFEGPHAYVSPSWYAAERAVPTWNYAVVHAYGTPRLMSDAELETFLADAVRFYEGGSPTPWRMELPEDYLAPLRKAIVGFEVEITRLEGKLKLSQNRPRVDQEGVIAALTGSGDPQREAVAALMDARLRRSGR